MLKAISERPLSSAQLASVDGFAAEWVGSALTLATSTGDLEEDGADGTLRLTPRGEFHLMALEGRRNGGEDRVETLTDLAMFLEARGIALSVPKQVAGVLLPDGQFQWGDAIYNVGVECSTLSKAAGQVVRNVKKARTAGYRVLIVLPEKSKVPQTLRVLDHAFPGLRIWEDGVGLVWKQSQTSFRPFRIPGIKVWPFLDEGGAPSELPLQTLPAPPRPDATVGTDPLIGRVLAVVREFAASGRTSATPQEILASLAGTERPALTEQQVGIALRALGLLRRRSRIDGTRVRIYDLKPMNHVAASEIAASRAVPTERPGPESSDDLDAH